MLSRLELAVLALQAELDNLQAEVTTLREAMKCMQHESHQLPHKDLPSPSAVQAHAAHLTISHVPWQVSTCTVLISIVQAAEVLA